MKKVFTIIGILVGIALVIVGILCLSGEMGGNASTASSAGYSYDSGYTKFGADFYTYVNNNAQEAAEAGRTAARNLWEIAKLLKNCIGAFFLCFGILCICFFGKELPSTAEQQRNAAISALEEMQKQNASLAQLLKEIKAQLPTGREAKGEEETV